MVPETDPPRARHRTRARPAGSRATVAPVRSRACPRPHGLACGLASCAEAVDLVEGDVVRFALASVPVGSGGHRVREVGALSRRERGVMKSVRRFDRFLLVKGPVPAHQRW